ncbi:MAG: aromatic ring-hydroxylating oxygenase subunit alpha [Candidatus Limnocylindrales bacterium]
MAVVRSPVTAAEVAAVRRPVDRASLLPPRVFHDQDVFAFEQESWFARTWLCIGREEDVAATGDYVLATVADESVIVVRSGDGELRAFHNVCRHRGSLIVTEAQGHLVRFQCPYHAWTYELDGSLRRAGHTDALVDFDPTTQGLHPVALSTWQGFVFIHLEPPRLSLVEHLADLAPAVERFAMADLRLAKRVEYMVEANWKVIAENYSECYHCPGVHPQLNRLTPYDQGGNLPSQGPWAGGWMELVGDAATMSTDGHLNGRAPLPGITTEDERRIHYFVLWPNLLLSLHPDYVMTHRVEPVAVGRSRVVCQWLFHPDAMAAAGFDPSDAIDFWDLTNRQDWRVCELQQKGTGSRAYVAGRYALMEDMVHAFDLMVADRYADDGVTTRFQPRNDKWRAAGSRRGR